MPIDAIIFGGRTRDREPLVRAITDLAEGVYDGLTLGAEATFAAEGIEGVSCATTRCRCVRSCPTPRAAYAAHWLKIIGAGQGPADLRPRQLVPARPRTATSSGPATATTCAPLLWLMQLKNGEVTGRQTPVGIIPTKEELEPRRRRRHAPRTSTRSCCHRRRPLAAGDGQPRGAPRRSSTVCPRRSGRRTAGSPPPSTPNPPDPSALTTDRN